MSLTLEEIGRVNLARARKWHNNGLDDWSISDWACAMAGEAGEVCNAVKKLNRLRHDIQQKSGPQSPDEAIAEIAKEIGDTFLYLHLLAVRCGIDFEDAIIATFNRVSEREDFEDRMVKR